MANFPVILTALDLSEMDKKLIDFTHFAAQQFISDKIYFYAYRSRLKCSGK
ncbi:MAG: hypothetical protein R2769_06830 [Saprospiraceae bacterium]